jgi:hypothetical protein
MLDALDESATQISYVGVHTLTDPGTATDALSGEATGGSYARQSVVWGAAASGLKSNTGALTIPVNTGTYGFLTFYNHVSTNSGNYRGYSPMGGASALKGFFSTDLVLSNDNLISSGHGMSDGDRVMLFNVFAETLPTGTGLTEGSVLFVVSSATNTFKVSLTSGGAAIDITALGGGEGFWQRVVPETFNAPGNITVAIGALTLDLTAM